MSLLLHACCGPCAVACADSLRGESLAPTLLWYNPNIHPFTEYTARRESLVKYSEESGLPLVFRDDYRLRAFVETVSPDFDKRCGHCYRIRMEQTALYAAENGFYGFSTTLLISPYQDHELIKAEGERAARIHGVDFIYRDFRPLFRQGQQQSRAMNLYMQKYCGCIFSEEDRYKKQIDRLTGSV